MSLRDSVRRAGWRVVVLVALWSIGSFSLLPAARAARARGVVIESPFLPDLDTDRHGWSVEYYAHRDSYPDLRVPALARTLAATRSSGG